MTTTPIPELPIWAFSMEYDADFIGGTANIENFGEF